ncbi:MAG: protein-L-isoaspartate(D-aspartate) O-methyltransferase [Acidimicrobiaceae bacterium]|nr:protein-L-isoaspartate(D-aspartate) O-methyltransferase [Acidimicrobiaceae bacterium]
MTGEAQRLRGALVDELLTRGVFSSHEVEGVMRDVPRHLFLDRFYRADDAGRWHEQRLDPGAPEQLVVAYADEAVITRVTAADGIATSSISQPGLVAQMLELLDLRPGHRVLEIGAGTGYNAALIAGLVGPGGSVTTVDVDRGVADQARRALAAAHCPGVTVAAGDGFLGLPEAAPFDRIVATVGSPDLSPHWVGQLSDAGRLLVPLEHGGVHPLMLVTVEGVSGGGVGGGGVVVRGRVAGRAGFVRGLGQLGRRGPWPAGSSALAGGAAPPPSSLPLPAMMAELVQEQVRTPAAWDFHYFLALQERDVPWLLTIAGAGGGGRAAVDPRAGNVVVDAGGQAALDRLLGRFRDWVDQGRPVAEAYRSRFVPRQDGGGTTEPVAEVPAAGGGWVIERPWYRQIVTLPFVSG